ncbi:MAG: DHH family phosphoesterase [Clostridia bacterium]|nr:DHH family phosphoesterase [Clostridia bacterium]
MKKHYGQITKTYTKAALISALLLIIGGIIFCITRSSFAGIAEIAAGAMIFIAVSVIQSRRKDSVNQFLNTLGKNSNSISANIMGSFPIPVVVTHIDGAIHWYNEKFSEMFSNKDLFDIKIEAVISDIKWGEILKTVSDYKKHIQLGEKNYLLIANTIKNKYAYSIDKEDKVSVYIYLIDKTAEFKLNKMYNNEKTDIAIINIDNYDDVLQRVNDNEQQQILSQIRQCVNEWAAEGNALVKNTDRDRYYVFFEHQYLADYVSKKFDILYKVRKVGEEIKLPVSISIGIGTGGSLSENDSYARSALDMALGRGGDQVSIKDDTQYKFYGSKARDYEKSTRVKTRAFAVALKDFIKNSDRVIFMGHSGADYDCFGAAIGLQRSVRTLGIKPYIIYDNNSPAVKVLYNELKSLPEYKGMFISGDEALEILTPDTLVVILDTHRPSMLPCPTLTERAAKVVLIDHHRRSTDFINPCSLIYHEPYASSTCEMATELLEYMNVGSSLTTLEAECLYTGILMDTKNFIVKTGVRTFEAASYLRRLGLNTADTKKLFNVSKEDYDHRADIVKTAKIIAPQIAVAKSYEKIPNIRVIASQAADEMLNIADIHASIVVYPIENAVGISARSLGDINVQLIMENLGGGGHSTVAGAQVRDKNIDMVVEDVINAVDEYLSNNEN